MQKAVFIYYSCALALGAVVAAAPAFAVTDPASYSITKTVPLGAPDRWDYAYYDATSHSVYVAHGSELTIVDAGEGKVTGSVKPVEGGTHGTAILSALGKGYTDDGDKGVAVEFDLKTHEISKTVPADQDADGIFYDAHSAHVFVIDSDPGKITVVDPATDKVVATVDAGGKLEFGVSGDDGSVYINGAEKNEIVKINSDKNQVEAHWPMPGCESPRGLALDKKNQRLFASCKNSKLVVTDAGSGKQVAVLDIGKGSDAVVFDAARQRIFSSNFDGTLSVVSQKDADTYEVLPPVKTALGARTMAEDPETGRIFLVTGDYTENEKAAPTDFRKRYALKPGSAKLLILDPVTAGAQ